MPPMRRNYIIDTKTSNISFKQTAADLHRLGIKNNLFMLRLYDKSLQGVDPFSPLLSQDMVVRIINECIINPWYYLREIARIPEQGGTSIPFQLHRGNLAVVFLFINGIDNYITIPRQKGKTQSIISILLWAFLFGTTNSEMLFVNIKEDGAINNLNRLKAQRDALPKYLQSNVVLDDDGRLVPGTDKNVKKLTNFGNKNKIVVAASASSVTKADSIGRGYTQPIQYYDEVEFINFIATIMEAAGPAFAKASQNAKKNGAIYGRLFSSTPGDLDSGPGQDAATILENACRFTEKMYDMFDEGGKAALEEYVKSNSTNGIVYIEFSYRQLGEDENWFYEMARVVNNKPEKIKRELLLQRISGSSLSPFSPEDIMALESHKADPIEERFVMPNYKLDIFEPINPQKCYFVGVDVSNGYGQDNTAVIIFDPYDMKIVAEFKSPYIGVPDTVKFLRILIKKVIPRGILCIERNMSGESVISYLRESDVRHAIYYDYVKELCDGTVEERLDDKGLLKLEAARRRLFGVYTQGKSRTLMFTLLDKYMVENKAMFRGRDVINDIKKLIMKNGKIQAGPGAHDDCIMALLVCLYVLHYGKQLNRFGFYKGEFIPDEDKREEDDQNFIAQVLDDIPELKSLYGEPQSVKTSDDYEIDIMKEIIKNRQMYAQTEFYDSAQGVRVRTENLNDDADDPMSGYTDLGGDFFALLND